MSALFVVIAVVQVGLAMQVVVRSKLRPWPMIVLVVVLLGLAYDNGIVGVGAAIGEGEGLERLNLIRFVLHALLTPLMLLVGRAIAVGAGASAWATKTSERLVLAVVVVLIAIGFVQEVLPLDLVLTAEQGTVRYAAEGGGPPVGAIITIIALIVLGWATRRAGGGSTLFVGAVIMFVAAGAGASSLWLSNVGELVLALAITTAALRLVAQRDDSKLWTDD